MGRLVMAISAGITAFVLAITAGAIYTYRNQTASGSVSAPIATDPGPAVDMVAVSSPPQVANVSPQDAASAAAAFLHRTDLYSVELTDFAGSQAYKVKFSSGFVVIVGLNGQILSSTPPAPPTVVTVTTGAGRRQRNDAGGGGNQGGGHDDGGNGGHESGDG